MSFSIGIVGLPNAGKSTLFKALTGKEVDIAPYAFCTRDPNIGIVPVPDKRLEKIAGIVKPKKITPTVIEFVDIAGLVKGAHKGEGLGNQFLSHIRSCDAVVEILRAFHAPEVEHIEGSVNPERDIGIVKTELLMKDLESLEGALQKLEKEKRAGGKEPARKYELLQRIKQGVSADKLISEIKLGEEENLSLKEYQFLTKKPIVFVVNYSDGSPPDQSDQPGRLPGTPGSRPGARMPMLALNLKLEQEISELSEQEMKELKIETGLDKLIQACYNGLALLTFFTIAGGEEVRAWTLQKGESAARAAGSVHSDFEEKFIRAEVIGWQKLLAAGGWLKAKEKGWLQATGKNYLVQDGDVIEFKI